MKELTLFRIFALFPFIGSVVPDLADALHYYSFSSIPTEHIVVDLSLCISLIVCSAGMWAKEMRAATKSKGNYEQENSNMPVLQ